MKLFKEIKGVFLPPKKTYYLGKTVYGIPYFYPWNFNSTILTIRKEKPKFLRCKHFKLFGYKVSYGSPIYIYWHGLGWKDKYNSPRFEWSPAFYMFFFKCQFVIHWVSPNKNNDTYYEMILWYLKYSDKDIKKAEETWGWQDCKTKESTWDNSLIIKTK
jgi:hypothetical protein